MKNKLSSEHMILSVENPLVKPHGDAPAHAEAMKYLKDQGEDVHEVHGKYGQHEKSILISKPKNPSGIHALAEHTGQESYIHSNGKDHKMIYVNGPKKGHHIAGSGTNFFNKKPEDFYSTIKNPDGSKTHFQHNFDFDTLHKETEHHPENLQIKKHEVPFGPILFIHLEDEDSSVLNKTKPEYEGQEHPSQPWVAKTHSSGSLMWHANPDQAKRIDSAISDERRISHFLSKVPESHRKAMHGVIKMVQKDPNRHFIPTRDGTKDKIRARHVRNLLSGDGDVSINTSHPGEIHISRDSHSSQKQYGKITIPYTFKSEGVSKNDSDERIEKHDESGAFRSSPYVFLGSGVAFSLYSRGSDVHSESGRTHDAVQNSDGKEGLREDLIKVSEYYKKQVKEGSALLHPVTIQGKTHSKHDIPFHTTIKVFNTNTDSSDEAHKIASKLRMNPPDPAKTTIYPVKLKDKTGEDLFAIELGGDANRVKDHHSQFEHMGYPRKYSYTPHITIDEDIYNSLKDSKAKTAKDFGIEFGPAELRQGENKVKSY